MKNDVKSKNLENRVKQIIAEYTGTSVNNIKLKSDLREDLGIDSFAAIELIFSLKEKFGLTLEDAELRKIKTVHDIIGIVKNKIKN
ncbi:MAG: acyl carrier protein [Candidatus Omnitrophota bacterium]|jgi:acyl carrier protein